MTPKSERRIHMEAAIVGFLIWYSRDELFALGFSRLCGDPFKRSLRLQHDLSPVGTVKPGANHALTRRETVFMFLKKPVKFR